MLSLGSFTIQREKIQGKRQSKEAFFQISIQQFFCTYKQGKKALLQAPTGPQMQLNLCFILAYSVAIKKQ